MSPALIIGDQCPYCRKFRSPRDILHQPGGVKICTECQQRHQEALHVVATGNFLGECSECHMKYEELKAQGRVGPQSQVAVHFENGRYRAMCLVCDRAYVRKRRELYGNTEFGQAMKL
jgi:hypothetical protein